MYFECRINKIALLQTVILVILPTGALLHNGLEVKYRGQFYPDNHPDSHLYLPSRIFFKYCFIKSNAWLKSFVSDPFTVVVSEAFVMWHSEIE